MAVVFLFPPENSAVSMLYESPYMEEEVEAGDAASFAKILIMRREERGRYENPGCLIYSLLSNHLKFPNNYSKCLFIVSPMVKSEKV